MTEIHSRKQKTPLSNVSQREEGEKKEKTRRKEGWSKRMSQDPSKPPDPDFQEQEPSPFAAGSTSESTPSMTLTEERLKQLPAWLQKEIIEGPLAASQPTPSGETPAPQSEGEPLRSAVAQTQSSSPSFSTKEYLQKTFRVLIPFLLGGFLIMFFGFLTLFPSLPPIFSYAQGECTITSSTSASALVLSNKKWVRRYAPVFTFVLRTADQQVYEATGYQAQPEYSSYENAEAIENSYHYGQTYPCWYDPATPTHAVLERNLDSVGSFLFLVGFGLDGFFVFLWVKFVVLPALQRRRDL